MFNWKEFIANFILIILTCIVIGVVIGILVSLVIVLVMAVPIPQFLSYLILGATLLTFTGIIVVDIIQHKRGR